jgi:hypothetical protein
MKRYLLPMIATVLFIVPTHVIAMHGNARPENELTTCPECRRRFKHIHYQKHLLTKYHQKYSCVNSEKELLKKNKCFNNQSSQSTKIAQKIAQTAATDLVKTKTLEEKLKFIAKTLPKIKTSQYQKHH